MCVDWLICEVIDILHLFTKAWITIFIEVKGVKTTKSDNQIFLWKLTQFQTIEYIIYVQTYKQKCK